MCAFVFEVGELEPGSLDRRTVAVDEAWSGERRTGEGTQVRGRRAGEDART